MRYFCIALFFSCTPLRFQSCFQMHENRKVETKYINVYLFVVDVNLKQHFQCVLSFFSMIFMGVLKSISNARKYYTYMHKNHLILSHYSSLWFFFFMCSKVQKFYSTVTFLMLKLFCLRLLEKENK